MATTRDSSHVTYAHILDADQIRHERGLEEARREGEEAPKSLRNVALLGGTDTVVLGRLGSNFFLGSGGYDGSVMLVEFSEASPALNELVGSGEPISAIVHTYLDGTARLLAADLSEGGMIRQWQLGTDTGLLPPATGTLPAPVMGMTVGNLPDGSQVLVTVDEDSDVALRDIQTGEVSRQVSAASDLQIGALTTGYWQGWSILVTAGVLPRNGEVVIRILDLMTSNLLAEIPAAAFEWVSEVLVVDLPDGPDIFLAGRPREASEGGFFWRIVHQGEDWTLAPVVLSPRSARDDFDNFDIEEITVLEPIPGAERGLVAVGTSGTLWIINVLDGTYAFETVLPVNRYNNQAIAYIEYDAKHALLYGHDGSIAIQVPDSVEQDQDEVPHIVLKGLFYGAQRGSITTIAALADRSLVASGGTDGTVRVWHNTEDCDTIINLGSPVRQLIITRPNRLIVRTDLGLLCLYV